MARKHPTLGSIKTYGGRTNFLNGSKVPEHAIPKPPFGDDITTSWDEIFSKIREIDWNVLRPSASQHLP